MPIDVEEEDGAGAGAAGGEGDAVAWRYGAGRCGGGPAAPWAGWPTRG